MSLVKQFEANVNVNQSDCVSLAFVKGATDVLLGGHFPHVIDNNHFEIISLRGYDYRITV